MTTMVCKTSAEPWPAPCWRPAAGREKDIDSTMKTPLSASCLSVNGNGAPDSAGLHCYAFSVT